MTIADYCATILAPQTLPCVVSDIHTEEIVFYNQAFATLMSPVVCQPYIGQKFYDVIVNHDAPYPYRGGTWTHDQLLEHPIFDKNLNVRLSASHTPLWFEDTYYNLCTLRPLDSEDSYTMTFEDAMTQCLSILHHDHEIVPSFLELLGHYYDAEKTYLYHVDRESLSITCEESWTVDKQLDVTKHLGTKIDIDGVLEWLDTRNEVGIIEANETHSAENSHPVAGIVLATFHMRNLVLSVITDSKKEVIAVIGIANRKESGTDFRLLQTVTRFMGEKVSQAEMKLALQQMNEVDILTGFFSRVSYSKRVEALEQHPPKLFGVVFININGLKKINADFGYAQGDSFIKKCAKRVQDHFSGEFYRISGDEFIGFFPDFMKDEFQSKVDSLHEELRQTSNFPFALGHSWTSGRIDVLQQVREADTVMYINKQEYYHSSSRRLSDISDSTLSDLLGYLDNDEFMVYLQPQVNLSDGSLYGAEALIRRFDKTNGKMVFPDQFIPLYEKKSVIRHVDIFVVDKVCRLLALWGNDYKQIPISVNLSRVTLLEFGIAETISKICDHYDIPHQLLVIEVTERVGLIENNVASSLIQEFQRLGFHISLDDFGCAYSNIVTLAQISVNEVKIDKSLVDYLVPNKKNRVLVKNILTMVNELEDTSTLAEGIEDEDQANLLRQYHCHLGQGYHYSRPIPDTEFFEKYILPTKIS